MVLVGLLVGEQLSKDRQTVGINKINAYLRIEN